jgi:hypothetical protein
MVWPPGAGGGRHHRRNPGLTANSTPLLANSTPLLQELLICLHRVLPGGPRSMLITTVTSRAQPPMPRPLHTRRDPRSRSVWGQEIKSGRPRPALG